MKRKAVISCLVLLLSSPVTLSQNTASVPRPENTKNTLVEEVVFHSASLNRDMHYLVLLPRDYADGRRFPVLYLLHGLYGITETGIRGRAWKAPPNQYPC